MKATLILAGSDSLCFKTENIWKNVCAENNIEFEKFDLTHSQGKNIAKKLDIKSFPALIINNKIVAVGHPNKESAAEVIKKMNK